MKASGATPAAMKLRLALVAATFTFACGNDGCLGIEVTNPDYKDGEMPSPPQLLVATPSHLELGPVCAGGTARATFHLSSTVERYVLGSVETPAGEEAYPSTFEIPPYEALEVAVVIPTSADAAVVEGRLDIPHAYHAATWDSVLPLPYHVAIGGPALRSPAVLCGSEAPCEALAFEPVLPGGETARRLVLVNDGCAVLTIQSVEMIPEGSPAEDASITGATLPQLLAPGARLELAAVLRPQESGDRHGVIRVASDGGSLSLPWTATVR